jgi:hypothetical protein
MSLIAAASPRICSCRLPRRRYTLKPSIRLPIRSVPISDGALPVLHAERQVRPDLAACERLPRACLLHAMRPRSSSGRLSSAHCSRSARAGSSAGSGVSDDRHGRVGGLVQDRVQPGAATVAHRTHPRDVRGMRATSTPARSTSLCRPRPPSTSSSRPARTGSASPASPASRPAGGPPGRSRRTPWPRRARPPTTPPPLALLRHARSLPRDFADRRSLPGNGSICMAWTDGQPSRPGMSCSADPAARRS